MRIPEMCELYNTFLKSYNTVANITAQLYSGKERSWKEVKEIKKDKQVSLI
jgi:hypothetical protein